MNSINSSMGAQNVNNINTDKKSQVAVKNESEMKNPSDTFNTSSADDKSGNWNMREVLNTIGFVGILASPIIGIAAIAGGAYLLAGGVAAGIVGGALTGGLAVALANFKGFN